MNEWGSNGAAGSDARCTQPSAADARAVLIDGVCSAPVHGLVGQQQQQTALMPIAGGIFLCSSRPAAVSLHRLAMRPSSSSSGRLGTAKGQGAAVPAELAALLQVATEESSRSSSGEEANAGGPFSPDGRLITAVVVSAAREADSMAPGALWSCVAVTTVRGKPSGTRQHWGPQTHSDAAAAVRSSGVDEEIIKGRHDRSEVDTDIANITLYDVASLHFRPATTPLSVESPVAAMAFAEDGRYLLCGCTDGIVRVWRAAMAAHQQFCPLATFVCDPHGSAVTAIACVPANSTALADWAAQHLTDRHHDYNSHNWHHTRKKKSVISLGLPVVAGTADGPLHLFDAMSGRSVWKSKTGTTGDTTGAGTCGSAAATCRLGAWTSGVASGMGASPSSFSVAHHDGQGPARSFTALTRPPRRDSTAAAPSLICSPGDDAEVWNTWDGDKEKEDEDTVVTPHDSIVDRSPETSCSVSFNGDVTLILAVSSASAMLVSTSTGEVRHSFDPADLSFLTDARAEKLRKLGVDIDDVLSGDYDPLAATATMGRSGGGGSGTAALARMHRGSRRISAGPAGRTGGGGDSPDSNGPGLLRRTTPAPLRSARLLSSPSPVLRIFLGRLPLRHLGRCPSGC